MIDKKWLGHRFPKAVCEVEKGRVRAFAEAIGDARPECHDEAAAQALGYASLVAPPTFAGVLHGEAEALLGALGVEFTNLLHGEQSFTYEQPILAGDVMTTETEVVEIAPKKNGAMELLTLQTTLTNQRGERAGIVRSTYVIVHAR